MRPTPVETVLHIEEILLLILQYCDSPSLLRLACTCRYISRPTHDVLWSRQRSLTILIEQLPADVVRPVKSRLSLDDSSQDQDSDAGVPTHQVGDAVPDGASSLESTQPSAEHNSDSETNSVPLATPVPQTLGSTTDSIHVTGLTQTHHPPLLQRLQRIPTEDELAPLLRQSRMAVEIVYQNHDARAAKVFEALITLFPSIDFFHSLQRVIICPQTTVIPRGGSYYSPNVLFRNAREVVIRSVIDGELQRPGVYTQHWLRTPMRNPERDVDLICSALVRSNSPPTTIDSFTIDSNHYSLERPLDGIEWCFISLGKGLRFLSIPSLPHLTYWILIAQMEGLEELHLGQFLYTSYTTLPYDSGSGSDWTPLDFPSLRRLSISGYAFDQFDRLKSALNATSFSSLESVALSLACSTPLLEHPGELVAWIGTGAPSLLRFHLSITSCSISHDPVIIGIDTLRPLFACTSLSELVISDGLSPLAPVNRKTVIPFLDDASVIEMVQHWPNLKILSIVPQEASGSAVTLAGLAPFGLHAHALEKLELGIEETNPHLLYAPEMYRIPLFPYDAVPDGESSHSRLREMNIGTPLVHNTAAASEFLRAFFPRLRKMTMPQNQEQGSARMYAWEKVIKLVLGTSQAEARGEIGVRKDVVEKQVEMEFDDDDDDDDDYYDDEVWEYSSSSENEEQNEESEVEESHDRQRLERVLLDMEDLVRQLSKPE